MKKTIATLAILVSANSAFALVGPGPSPARKDVCLPVYKQADRGLVASDCDENENNVSEKRRLLQNGCAKNQVALNVLADTPIRSCMAPGVVQL